MDKTFDAISKLKEVEIELHRLKNALEMMNRAYEPKKEWVELTKEECFELCVKHKDAPFSLLLAVQDKLKEKNGY